MTKAQLDELKNYLNELIDVRSKPQINTSNRKIEFSKIWLITTTLIAITFTALSYVLSYFDKNPVENLSIEIIKMVWGVDGISFLGYNIQNCVRALSFNKANSSDTDM